MQLQERLSRTEWLDLGEVGVKPQKDAQDPVCVTGSGQGGRNMGQCLWVIQEICCLSAA